MTDKLELLGLMICPACRTKLTSYESCGACGATFVQTHGLPSVFQSTVARTVSFQFTPQRAVMSDGFRAAFNYPLRRGGLPPGLAPYHLDAAHLDVIDRLPRGALVLEVGCGGGQMREFLRTKGLRYIGIDISTSRVGADLQSKGGPDLLCDAHFLPFADQSFDLIYTSAVTEHLACPYLVAQEVFRALKPGAAYLGNVSFLEPWHDDSFFHMSPLGVYELLTQAQFDVPAIWPGQGYDGFTAILSMGNKATRPLRFVGKALNAAYRYGNMARNLVKRREHWNVDRIEDAARISGATDWIAMRPQ